MRNSVSLLNANSYGLIEKDLDPHVNAKDETSELLYTVLSSEAEWLGDWSRLIVSFPAFYISSKSGMTEKLNICAACCLMQSRGFGPVETKEVYTRLATKPWINGSYFMPFSRVHCGDMCWWPVLERSLSQWYLCCTSILQIRLCRPANDLVCVMFCSCGEKVFMWVMGKCVKWVMSG